MGNVEETTIATYIGIHDAHKIIDSIFFHEL